MFLLRSPNRPSPCSRFFPSACFPSPLSVHTLFLLFSPHNGMFFLLSDYSSFTVFPTILHVSLSPAGFSLTSSIFLLFSSLCVPFSAAKIILLPRYCLTLSVFHKRVFRQSACSPFSAGFLDDLFCPPFGLTACSVCRTKVVLCHYYVSFSSTLPFILLPGSVTLLPAPLLYLGTH